MKPRCSPVGIAIGSRPRGEFEEAAPARFLRAGNGARAEEIADRKIAAVAGVMGDHLCDRPIRRRERRLGEALWRDAGTPHRVGCHVSFERDVEATSLLIRGVGEIRQRRGIAFRPRERCDAKRRQGFPRHHPGRYRGGEIFSEERSERLIFPTLDVARRPVVQKAEAENMLRSLGDGDGVAERRRHADVEAELKLEIEIARRSVARHRFLRALALALRPLHRSSADADRRSAAVIGDRHVFVVRQQRIFRPESAAGIGGVEHRGIEVGEVADHGRQHDLRLRHRREMLPQALVAVIGAQTPRQR
jgi:hypothetical protein